MEQENSIPAMPLTLAEETALFQAKLNLSSTVKRSAGWFYWIAGMSLINMVAYRTGATLSFLVGLGITQVIDVLSVSIANKASGTAALLVHGIGIALDLGVGFLFGMAGFLGQRMYRWAVVSGIILYVLDGLLFVVFQDWLPLAFHLFVLFNLWKGLKAMGQLKKLEQTGKIETPIAGPGFGRQKELSRDAKKIVNGL
jgi:hypothetical protein